MRTRMISSVHPLQYCRAGAAVPVHCFGHRKRKNEPPPLPHFGRLENQLSERIFPPKMNAANDTSAQHLVTIGMTCLRSCASRDLTPPTGGPNWRSTSASSCVKSGVGAGPGQTRAHSVLMSVSRTCRQQGCRALDFLSQLLRSTPVAFPCPVTCAGQPRELL